MGTIQKRIRLDGTPAYRCMVRLRGHEPLTKTFDRRGDAVDWVRSVEQRIKLGEAATSEAQRTTLAEALGRYLRERVPQLKGKAREKNRVKAWQREPIAARYLTRIGGKDLAAYRDRRRAEGVADATIRAELMTVSALYRWAVKEWGMEGLRNPVKAMTLPAASEHRDRRLQGDEEARLMAALAAEGPMLRPLAQFALESCMRQGELLALTWADVNLQGRVARLRDAKAGAREVPLSSRAVELLQALPRALDAQARVFPLKQDNLIRAFRRACTAAGIEGVTFHTLRHEGITRVCARLTLPEALKVSGHKTPAMLMRYYHPKAEELAQKLG